MYAMVVILSYVVGDSESIQVINLSWNQLRRKGAEAIAESIKVYIPIYVSTDQKLRHCDLSMLGNGP